jgi:predicted phage terminase large subunit-like protein
MSKLSPDVIQGFVSSILSQGFDGAVESPPFHREVWELCCSPHKYVAVAAPRGHAKSSGVTLGYGMSTLLFRERKFMLLVSDTEAQAALFLGTFKQALQDNQDLIELFDLKRNEKGQVQFLKDTENDIIVEFNDGHRFRIIAKGAEQKLRGLLWNGSRPDIILCDDMENDELVMNKDRREKMKRWFKGALLPCISDKGIVRMVGTILHMDSLLENVMPRENDKQTVHEGLKTYSKARSLWKSVKYRAHNEDFTELLWPQKKSAEWFKMLYNEAVRDGTTDVYSQEYLNYPLDMSTTYFKKADFMPISEEDKKAKLLYYVTADLAISENERADYSVFLVAGVDENKVIHVKNVIRERMDGREIVDTLLALQRLYKPEAVGIEDMQVSKSIGPFLREEMVKTNTFLNLYPLKHGGKDKLTRSRSIQARMRAKGIKFDKESDWYGEFEEELLRFPRAKHDDQVDTFAYLGLMLDKLIEAPTQVEMDEEEYMEEMRKSDLEDTGRNNFTGY